MPIKDMKEKSLVYQKRLVYRSSANKEKHCQNLYTMFCR